MVNTIDIQDKAVEMLRSRLAENPDKIGIRVSVVNAGCGGYAYKLEYAIDSEEADTLVEQDGVTLIVDPKSLLHLIGTRLEYEKVGLNEGYKFVNPNVSGECGCGESFYV